MSCLPQSPKNADHVIAILILLHHLLFLCIKTPKICNFSNFHQIELRFGLGIAVGDPDFKFQLKIESNLKN